MPLEERTRLNTSSKPALDLPPPFRLITLREVGDAFAHAASVAAEAGAGTLVYVGRFDLAEFAVVLEPEEPLETARRALYAGLVALADALAAHAPPERPISFDWPDAVRVNGGLVGGARLGWPQGAPENKPPAWLVFGAMIRTVAMGEDEPGLRPLSAALEEEGFEDFDSGPPGGKLRAPSHGGDRHLAGEGVRRSCKELSRRASARKRGAPRTRWQRRSPGAAHRDWWRQRRAPVAGARAGSTVVARSRDRRSAAMMRIPAPALDVTQRKATGAQPRARTVGTA